MLAYWCISLNLGSFESVFVVLVPTLVGATASKII